MDHQSSSSWLVVGRERFARENMLLLAANIIVGTWLLPLAANLLVLENRRYLHCNRTLHARHASYAGCSLRTLLFISNKTFKIWTWILRISLAPWLNIIIILILSAFDAFRVRSTVELPEWSWPRRAVSSSSLAQTPVYWMRRCVAGRPRRSSYRRRPQTTDERSLRRSQTLKRSKYSNCRSSCANA